MDITSSSVLVGGAVTSPIQAKVSPTAATSFAGSFAAVFLGPACPTAATLAAALPKAYLATPKSSPGVTMAPSAAVVTMGSAEQQVGGGCVIPSSHLGLAFGKDAGCMLCLAGV